MVTATNFLVAKTSQILRWWRSLKNRPAIIALAALVLFGSVSYQFGIMIQSQRYSLSREVQHLVGDVNPNLASKLKLDQEKDTYVFNGGVEKPTSASLDGGPDPAAALASLKQQTGGGGKKSDNLYALDVPLDPKKGVTYYDKNLKLSFKTTPQFDLSTARADEDGRLVFPGNNGTKAVYSLKTNGLKEDMILTKPIGDSFSFSYKLDLPKELEARPLSDGSIGIFSADPVLFGNVTYGGDQDFEKLKSARETATKDHLVFAIPAPVIIQANKKTHNAQSKFVLNGEILTVESTGLEQLKYPVSIDPSVVVTSSSDFQSGNNEGGIEFATDEIKRGTLTGGINGSWTASSNLITAREMHSAETYNGYAYVIGGYSGTTALDSVGYAPINSDGSLGTWQFTSSFTNPRYGHATTVYNGYMYLVGGNQGADVILGDMQYAKINADGTLGPWQATSSLAGVRQQLSLSAYNGYLYALGGASSATNYQNNTQYAKINADGTIGTWQAGTTLTGTRAFHAAEVSNGYIYAMGGKNISALSTVEYARINADGTLGSWATTSAMLAGRSNHASATYNGYVYVIGGLNGSSSYVATIEYAPIQSNGTLGAWRAGVSFATARSNLGTFESKGRLYVVGGYNGTSRLADSQYAAIMPVGMTGIGIATTAIPTVRAQGKDYGRYGHSTVVYNGYIYVIGGFANAGVATVNYASINAANNTIGAWSTTTALPAARYYHASVVHRGYLYVIGGYTTAHTNSILYSQIGGTGALGAWTTQASTFTNARSAHSAVTLDNKLYILGGYGTSFVEYADVQYATFAANGSVGAFTASTSFANARDGHSAAIMGKYIYVVGGWNGTTNYADVQFAEINPSGGLIGGLSSCPGGGTLTGGTWCTTSSLQTARHAHTGYSLKGCLYVVGGGIAGGVTASAEYACSNADGTLQQWSAATQPSQTARNNASGAVYEDMLYLIGGESSGQPAFADVTFAPINQGGDGMPQGFVSTTAFGTSRYSHTTVVANGFMYIVGGRNTTTFYTDVQFAPINDDGTVGTWQATSSFPTARADHKTVVSNGYMYNLGGCNGATPTTNTQYAAINANGTLGAWTNTTALPLARCEHAAVANNGYVYVIGGTADGTTGTSTVYRSTINVSTGALGTWSTMSALNNIRKSGAEAVINNGYMYVLGGLTTAAVERAVSVEFAKINGDGTLGAWSYTTSLPDRREFAGVAAYNGRIYITMGNTGSGNSTLVFSAPFVGTSGHLGDWVGAGSVLSARLRHGTIFHNGILYVTGGYNGSAPLDEVNYAGVSSISRRASYTKLADLGTLSNINSVTLNGTGDRALTFRLAGSDGLFGASQAAGTAGGASARYVSIRVALDDTPDVIYPEVLSRKSVSTDITVDYASAAVACTNDQRLRHGASFSTGVLQPLNTCLP